MDTLTHQLTMLAFDNVRLAVPLSEVVTIERTRQMQLDHGAAHRLGRVIHRDDEYPVYSFSQTFDLLTQLPTQRLFCVCLQANPGKTRLALACDTTMPIQLEQSELFNSLPECMQGTDTPLQGFFKNGQQLVLFSTTAGLATYIHQMETQYECAC